MVGGVVEVLVVVAAGGLAVEGEVVLSFPVQFGACPADLIVAVAGAGYLQCHVGGVSGDPVGDAAELDVRLLGQAEVLFGRHVTEYSRAVVGRGCGADAAGDVVVAGEHVGDQWSEDVERCAVAEAALQFHVVFDLIEGDVPGPFDDDLYAVSPGAFRQLSQRFQLSQLGVVGGVGEGSGAQAVADAERDVILAHDPADIVPQVEHGVLPVVVDHPLGQQAAAA